MHNEEQIPDKENQQLEAELIDIMFSIKQRFRPVQNIKQANTTFTTAEFADKIKEHYPGAEFMDNNDVYQLLKKEGYTYSAVGSESKLEWLVYKV
ncbi:MAG: hypothetical protein V4608_03325 [Bacteroidota bacterium]